MENNENTKTYWVAVESDSDWLWDWYNCIDVADLTDADARSDAEDISSRAKFFEDPDGGAAYAYTTTEPEDDPEGRSLTWMQAEAPVDDPWDTLKSELYDYYYAMISSWISRHRPDDPDEE